MTRFITLTIIVISTILLFNCQKNKPSEKSGILHTVNGIILADSLKISLTHEHFMSNFGADMSVASEYDENTLYSQVIPHAKKVKSLGIHTVFDATAAYFGRRPDILKQIADSTGLQIVTNTGFYGAADDRYIPDFAFDTTPKQIADIWIDEFYNGIDDTGIKPGFIKLAFDSGSPSDIDLKLFKAGLITHLETGLTLTVHTGNNPEAVEAQIRLLEEFNISREAWVWIHAGQADTNLLIDTASKGAWISLDGANATNVQEIIGKLERFKAKTFFIKYCFLMMVTGSRTVEKSDPLTLYQRI
jgi:predicted metal-dependent phosphotriesterase family hydrolase